MNKIELVFLFYKSS